MRLSFFIEEILSELYTEQSLNKNIISPQKRLAIKQIKQKIFKDLFDLWLKTNTSQDVYIQLSKYATDYQSIINWLNQISTKSQIIPRLLIKLNEAEEIEQEPGPDEKKVKVKVEKPNPKNSGRIIPNEVLLQKVNTDHLSVDRNQALMTLTKNKEEYKHKDPKNEFSRKLNDIIEAYFTREQLDDIIVSKNKMVAIVSIVGDIELFLKENLTKEAVATKSSTISSVKTAQEDLFKLFLDEEFGNLIKHPNGEVEKHPNGKSEYPDYVYRVGGKEVAYIDSKGKDVKSPERSIPSIFGHGTDLLKNFLVRGEVRGEHNKISLSYSDIKSLMKSFGYGDNIEHYFFIIDNQLKTVENRDQIKKIVFPEKPVESMVNGKTFELIRVGEHKFTNPEGFRSTDAKIQTPIYHVEATFIKPKGGTIIKRLFRIEFRESVRDFLRDNPLHLKNILQEDPELLKKYSDQMAYYLANVSSHTKENFELMKPMLNRNWDLLSEVFKNTLAELMKKRHDV